MSHEPTVSPPAGVPTWSYKLPGVYDTFTDTAENNGTYQDRKRYESKDRQGAEQHWMSSILQLVLSDAESQSPIYVHHSQTECPALPAHVTPEEMYESPALLSL
ncbi:hypothetical protein WOLCODRAFT_15277 [Wolfiporia cocos MD-104 SS10]|uniref:Uncharacterized protein n=1 Tax=Wolfiporia cocos (strain MD-104) TaxID=742152 RepID=A0A2H3IWM9_WOLCO|nr:hypothetical protein WOLCODRAFT_15277 [Wolfiporia cocos MD-104 SS10]